MALKLMKLTMPDREAYLVMDRFLREEIEYIQKKLRVHPAESIIHQYLNADIDELDKALAVGAIRHIINDELF